MPYNLGAMLSPIQFSTWQADGDEISIGEQLHQIMLKHQVQSEGGLTKQQTSIRRSTNRESQSNRLPEYGTKTSRSELPDPEALPGGNDLLAYKYVLNLALKSISNEIIPEEFRDNKIMDFKVLQTELRKIEHGIKNRKYQSTRDKLHISADVVSIDTNRNRDAIPNYV